MVIEKGFEPICPFKKIWLVSSGKGGVGKSNIAINLAIALAQKSWDVAFLDLDLAHPSLSALMGLGQLGIRKKQNYYPVYKFGIRSFCASFEDVDLTLGTWRGRLAHDLVQAALFDVDWGSCDVLLIDLPTGINDIVLSLAQSCPQAEVILVHEQDPLSFQACLRLTNAFEGLGLRLKGLIQNNSRCLPQDMRYAGSEFCRRLELPFLGVLPYVQALAEGTFSGVPYMFSSSCKESMSFFSHLAHDLMLQNNNV